MPRGLVVGHLWVLGGLSSYPIEIVCRVAASVGAMRSSPFLGLQHVGAYNPGTAYDAGDPAWAWEKDGGWHRATIINGQRSWVTVRFVEGDRPPDGRVSKSYRPAKVWPAICDYPEPMLKIVIDKEQADVCDPALAQVIARQLGVNSRFGRHPGL